MTPARKIGKGIAIAIASFFLIVVPLGSIALVVVLSRGLGWGPEPTTQLRQYPETISALRPHWQRSMAHFPSNIPKQATRVQFFHLEPDVRFGGPFVVEVRMRLPPEEIKSLQAKFAAIAERQYVPETLPESEYNSPTTKIMSDGSEVEYSYTFRTGPLGEAARDFAKVRAIYVLGDDRGKPKHTGLYKTRYGVAIHEETSEIIYWVRND